MEKNFLIKKFSKNKLLNEFDFIGFDKSYKNIAQNKYDSSLYKIFDLSNIQATVLKQTALSVGTDCAVNKDVLTNNTNLSDVILFATKAQLKVIIDKLNKQPFGMKKLALDLENCEFRPAVNYKIKNSIFNSKKSYLMGILNITPDSFSDGGKFVKQEDAQKRYKELFELADIIDIGAESTKPNSIRIPDETEIQRLIPLFECIDTQNKVLSIDTINYKTAEFALSKGVDIVNNVNDIMNNESMLEIVKKYNSYIVITMNVPLKTTNIVDETIKNLMKRVEYVLRFGIKEEKIILDVGLGFNKTFDENIELIKSSKDITSLGFLTLYGVSRKSFVQKIADKKPLETEFANTTIAVYLANQGVNIIRVHDIEAHKIAFQTMEYLINT